MGGRKAEREKEMKRKIYYLAYYSNRDGGKKRDATPAVDLQVSYLSQVFSEIGFEVEIVALNARYSGEKFLSIQKGFTKHINDNITVRYFNCIESKYVLIRSIASRLIYMSAEKYIKQISDGVIVIYHSRIFYPYYHMLNRHKRRYILELEEIYSDVIGSIRKRKKEIKEVEGAAAYILPSIPLAEEITKGKNYVLYHGSCRNEEIIGNGFGDGRIHVVYAGIFDYRIIGDLSLIQAANYLDGNYHIHIIGFGRNQADLDRVLKAIERVQNLPCRVTYDGLLHGEEYLSFLQSCDIGVFSKNPDDDDINSSFPSKIMSYLSNGLRVVATRADSIQRSEVANIVEFCDTNQPKDVAEAIKRVDLNVPYDSRKELKKIEERLKTNLKKMLEDF